MNDAWLVWSLCAVFGASVARLIHADSLLEPLRNRWEAHWLARIDAVLTDADSHLQITRGSRAPAVVAKLRGEINDRAGAERGVRFLVRREQRERARPWSSYRDRLDRYAAWLEFISCPWCLPFWVFCGAVLWTWGRVYGFSGAVFAPVHIPVDYALITLVFGLRWIYGMVVVAVGQAR